MKNNLNQLADGDVLPVEVAALKLLQAERRQRLHSLGRLAPPSPRHCRL